jgi:hypothetical protein
MYPDNCKKALCWPVLADDFLITTPVSCPHKSINSSAFNKGAP